VIESHIPVDLNLQLHHSEKLRAWIWTFSPV